MATKTEHYETWLSKYNNTNVLVVGIGGGGDIVGTCALAVDLQNAGAQVLVGGLTWKRKSQDGPGRPRHKHEFINTGTGNDVLWYTSENTVIDKPVHAPYHIETVVAKLTSFPIVSIDVSEGIQTVHEGIRNFMHQQNIRAIIGVDVGGDVLCYGDEPTLHSPLCDQVMLACLAKMDAPVAVCGVGTDGEMTNHHLIQRSTKVHSALLTCIPPSDAAITLVNSLLQHPQANTECSRLFAQKASTYTLQERKLIASQFVVSPQKCLHPIESVSMRNGQRTADLMPATAVLPVYCAKEIWKSNVFSQWDLEKLSVEQMADVLDEHNIQHEFKENN